MSGIALCLVAALAAAVVGCSSDSSDDPKGSAGAAGTPGDAAAAETSDTSDAGPFHTSDGIPCGELETNLSCEVCCAWPIKTPPLVAYLSYLYENCRCAAGAQCETACKDSFCADADAGASDECKACKILDSDPCTMATGEQCRADPVCKPYMDCDDACQVLP